MARQEDWQRETREARMSEGWSLTGPTRVVKVVPMGRPIPAAMHGFACMEKVLLRKSPASIESMLGLPPGSLAQGCRVFKFRRLPGASEVAYELTADHPDGQVFNPAMHDPNYPPGDPTVHQWRLLADIPVDHLLDLSPGHLYPYLHR
jgi:hypothetical protein